MKSQGNIFCLERKKSFVVFVDWISMGIRQQPKLIRSGYLIEFVGCPLIWSSSLQTLHEYMTLSQALGEVTPLMELLREMKKFGIYTYSTHPTMYCIAFEDHSGA